MKASPMTFTVGGNQYVAVAAGPNILCFGTQPMQIPCTLRGPRDTAT